MAPVSDTDGTSPAPHAYLPGSAAPSLPATAVPRLTHLLPLAFPSVSSSASPCFAAEATPGFNIPVAFLKCRSFLALFASF